MCFFIAAWSYALCVNFVPYYRIPADSIGESNVGREQDRADASGVEADVEKDGPMHIEQRGGARAEEDRVGKE